MTSNHVALAYLITFHTYGTWLRGGEAGSVDKAHNDYGTPALPHKPAFEAQDSALMRQAPYCLDYSRRLTVLMAIQEVCAYRDWKLLAAHVRSNHVHLVVQADAGPEKVMNDLKAYCSRRLTEAGYEDKGRRRWTTHGSTRYLWVPQHVEAAIQYVVSEQGEPMAVFDSTVLTADKRDL